MKLLTDEIRKKLPKLKETEGVPTEDKIVICTFFNPIGLGIWHAIEGEEEDEDFIFWGLAEIYEQELGYFSLNELESVTLPLGQKIEREFHSREIRLKEFLK